MTPWHFLVIFHRDKVNRDIKLSLSWSRFVLSSPQPGELFLSQEYTEEKDVSLNALSGGRRVLEALLIAIAIFAFYLTVALVSFNPSDPSWSQTAWHEPIHNLGGSLGAWLADTLLFTFGVLAYALPIIILSLCWWIFRQRSNPHHFDYFTLALRLIGMLALILTSCGLATLNVDDLHYFASGGVIGSLLGNAMLPWLHGIGATLILLCIWAAGLTLFTGWSWLVIAEKIGGVVLGALAFISNRTRHRDEHQYSNEEEEPQENTLPDHANENNDVKNQQEKSHHGSIDPLDKVSLDAVEHTVAPNEADNIDLNEVKWLEEDDIDDGLLMQLELSASEQAPLLATTAPLQTDEPSLPASETVATHPDYSAVVQEPKRDNDLIPHAHIFPRQSTVFPAIVLAEPLPVVHDTAVVPERPFAPHQERDDISPIQTQQAMATVTPTIATQSVTITPATNHTETQLFTPVITNEAQIKQGSGPTLPTPNRVRVPTRRELASYGIKLPSQRLAEQAQRQQAKQQQATSTDDGELIDEENRPGESAVQPSSFTAHYPHTHYDSTAHLSYGISPLDDLVNDGPIEPLFTLSPMPESSDVPAEPVHQEVTPHQAQLPDNMRMDSLIHPFLMRSGTALPTPTTPLPSLDLLTSPPAEEMPVDEFELQQTARRVEACLADYRVKADVVGISPGPVITRFELDLAPGVKAARISNLSRDLARSLSAVAVRVVEVIPGKPYVGLELPNKHRQTVYLREVLDCDKFRDTLSPLAIVLGKDIAGQPVVADLAKMPHLLVAGTTGSGKSVGVNAMILSMLYKATPEEVRFIMIDPKMLELSVYEGIPHLLTEVVTDMKDAANALRWCVGEMERRYKLMSALGVRNLAGYNEKVELADTMGRPIPDPFWKGGDSMDITPPVLEKLPYIVVLVDEFADLMMAVGKKVEELIARLAQKARAAGIHLVLATQRPSVDVITGLIKANIPTRVAFTVSSKIDSRTILDQSGAESLLGMGDMLYMAPNSSIPIRVHGAFVRDQEVHAVVNDWKARGRPQYIENITASEEGDSSGSGIDSDEALDPLFDQAVAFVVDKRRASISGVQRQFRIGYNRAARIIEQMEAQGIVSEQGHNGNREVLAPPGTE